MSIVELFNDNFSQTNELDSADLLLVQYSDNVFVGVTCNDDVVVAVKAADPHQSAMARRTALISVECNMHMTYVCGGQESSDVFHLIKCFAKEKQEIELFLETAMLLIEEGDQKRESIISTFQTLASFFDDKREPTDNELNGLYAELFTIYKFNDTLHLGEHWQSKDRLKFDFSISEKVKIEVKATIKNKRIHHFRHEQLSTDIYDVFILSYMLLHDDEGLSLLELINIAKPMVEADSRKVLRLNRVLKNVDNNRLANISYGETHTAANLKIVRGDDAPKFTEMKPDGVANAEYDCDLENVSAVPLDVFITEISDVENNN